MKSLKTSLIALAATFAFAANAVAGPILVDEWAGNSGDANELADVTAAIAAYNVANDPDLPALGATFLAKTTSVSGFTTDGGHTINWTAPGDFDFYYVMTKWGQGQANFDHALHYVLAGETLNYNPGGAGNPPQGLSHIWIWGGDKTRVPDGGSTIALMGAALAGLSMIRRRK